jgi:hypothetical protein
MMKRYLAGLLLIMLCGMAFAGGKKETAGAAPEPVKTPVEAPEPEPAKPPAWAESPNGVEAEYPNAQYIARRGRGADLIAAQNDGVVQISRYFTSEISSSQSARQTVTQTNDFTVEQTETNVETFVTAQTNLFAGRYAEDAWFNGAGKQWETVAYIDRGEAWTIYEPQLRRKTAPFMAVFEAAEQDTDPLRQYYRYTAARKADLADIAAALDFAQILHPQKAAGFNAVRTALAEVSFKADTAKAHTSISIFCDSDMDNLLYTALTGAFSANGFKVERNKEAASNQCEARISDNKQELEAGTFYSPSIDIALSGKAGLLFTYTASVGRQGASNPDIAKRRAYTALGAEIKRTFYEEFDAKMREF